MQVKEKGFTLIELVGVVVILAIIALVVFPATLNVLNQGQTNVDNSIKDLVITAANEYVGDRINNFPKQLENKTGERSYGSKGKITTQMLVQNGYLEQSVIDENCEIQDDYVTVTSNTQKYIFEYVEGTANNACD